MNEFMKNIFYLSIIFFAFSSCIKEHDIFYPYKKDSLVLLESLKGENKYLVFRNSEGLNFFDENGFTMSIDKNSFTSLTDSIIIQWRLINTTRKIIANRFSMIDKSNYLISPYTIIDFKLKDNHGKEIQLLENSYISFSIPDSSVENLSIFRYYHNEWVLSKSGQDLISYHSWTYMKNGSSVNEKGYLYKTQNAGITGLGKYIDKNWKSTEIKIQMNDSYSVENTIVQMVFPDSKFNIELEWDNEKKAFIIPANFLFPHNKLNIIALSEDTDHNPYFGMKYAEITDENEVQIEIFKTKIEEIKDILDKI